MNNAIFVHHDLSFIKIDWFSCGHNIELANNICLLMMFEWISKF